MGAVLDDEASPRINPSPRRRVYPAKVRASWRREPSLRRDFSRQPTTRPNCQREMLYSFQLKSRRRKGESARSGEYPESRAAAMRPSPRRQCPSSREPNPRPPSMRAAVSSAGCPRYRARRLALTMSARRIEATIARSPRSRVVPRAALVPQGIGAVFCCPRKIPPQSKVSEQCVESIDNFAGWVSLWTCVAPRDARRRARRGALRTK
jgi:hypothetical protein